MDRIGSPPDVKAVAPKTGILGSFGQAFLIAGYWRAEPANLRALPFGKFGTDGRELNDLCVRWS